MSAGLVGMLVSGLASGGVVGAAATLIGARSAAKRADADTSALNLKTPAEVDSIVVGGAEKAVQTMRAALESAEARIRELEADRDADRTRIRELEDRLETLRAKVQTAEDALDEARQASRELRDALNELRRDAGGRPEQ